MAEHVSSIPLSPKDVGNDSLSTPTLLPLNEAPAAHRPARPLRVELMSPHQLWDLRDGPLKVPSIEVAEGTTKAVLVSDNSGQAPVVVLSTDASSPIPVAPTPPATTPATGSGAAFRTVQLGAYSSEQAARSAWDRLNTGTNAATLRGLAPQFEPTEVGGRQLVRLRVSAREDRVQNLCQSVASADPWCARAVTTADASTIFH
ncbi:SPOR domain-containing protein [Brevundimonas sp. GN22]